MKQQLITFVTSVLLATTLANIAQASTTMIYTSPCRYINTQGKVKASTKCNINFGTLSAAGGARYIVTFPNKAEIAVYIQTNGSATTNGIKSKVVMEGNNVVVTTKEGEMFIFKQFRR
jgi:hypothetical protein